MKRRKRIYHETFNTLKDAYEYMQKVKDINGKKVNVEMDEFEVLGHTYFAVDVWQVR